MPLKLNRSIFFRKYFDELYLYDTKCNKNYIFNSVATDIIEVISENPSIDFNDLIEKLFVIYKAPKDILSHDALNFVNILFEKGILYQDNYIPEIEKTEIPFEKQIAQKLSMNTGNNKTLLSVLLELTYRCNEKCIHCYATEDKPSEQKELTTNEWFEVLDQLYKNNVMFLTLTGGEVAVRSDFFDIFDYAIKKCFVIDIFSNGMAFSDNQIADIACRYPKSFQSSIYSHIPETHDKITRVKGSFEKTLHTLNEFKKLGVPIVVKTVMMKENCYDYDGLRNLVNDLGATLQVGTSIGAKNDGSFSPLFHRIEEDNILMPILKGEIIRQKSVPSNKELDMSLCGAGFNGISINPYGDVFPCNSLDIKLGSVKEQTISDIWAESVELEKVRNLSISNLLKCNCCDCLNYCQFCPGLALAETGLLEPYPEACKIAKIRRSVMEGGKAIESI